jgi:S1-C subfamily serine protease
MSKLTPRDATKQPLPEDRLNSPQWQQWMMRILPLLYVTILTIILPRILTQSFVVSKLGATPEQKLHQQLRSISIKVLAHGETIGSGVLLDAAQPQLEPDAASPAVSQPDRVYTAITNAHVIQAASAPFQLQTADGQVYAAALITPPSGQNRDLSILRFQSRRTYPTAKLALTSPKIGDRVWSAGFPLASKSVAVDNRPAEAVQDPVELNIVNGQITQILPVAMTGGYSIGSDQTIQKGMSGGPLINGAGELVGINGVHANPLWDTPEILEDGSTVTDGLQEQINNSSWAIPIEFVKDYANL